MNNNKSLITSEIIIGIKTGLCGLCALCVNLIFLYLCFNGDAQAHAGALSVVEPNIEAGILPHQLFFLRNQNSNRRIS
ncbi:MAG: hypothetical protein A2096_08450 [Spirochaetes bacterium GWF1_41_5]|nr:MAG: hypothetical protein A2096_08450 [Spirochaetes bacterium GWF1_41_5]